MIKKIAICVLAFLLTLTLCGCDFFTTDTSELLTPPSLSGDLKLISEAISDSVGKAYSFKYPQSGDYRSAVVQNDIDGDGTFEAVAFYSTTDGDVTMMNINLVSRVKDSWKSVAVQTIVAAGVHRVDFCDLNKDGVNEILVGWQIYGTSEMQLAVYSFTDGALIQRMLNKYNHFIVCDLDENQTNEVLVIDANTENSQNIATLYGFTNDGVVQMGRCMLDSKVQSFGHPIVSELSSGKIAVYIDSVKGIGAITEVLIYEKGKLSNPLYDEQLTETVSTLRSVSFATHDFNGDSVLEIPVQLDVPSVSKSEVAEKLYLTNWCSFNGEILTTQVTSMINVLDGYYYNIPANWVGNIAILKDTDNRIREIYTYDTEQMQVGKSLIYFRAIAKKEWDKGVYDALNLSEIGRIGDFVIACRISKEANVTLENVKSNFGIYNQEANK